MKILNNEEEKEYDKSYKKEIFYHKIIGVIIFIEIIIGLIGVKFI